MADTQQYGPSVTAATTGQAGVPPVLIKEENMSNSPQSVTTEQAEALTAAAAGSLQSADAAGNGGALPGIGTLGPEVNHGDEVVKAAAEFERQSRKMKGQITVKVEAESGMADTQQPEMAKSVGVTARTYVKPDDKDHTAEWTDVQTEKLKKEKETKSKKRKREEAERNAAKQQLEELKKKSSDIEITPKPKKKAKKSNNQNAAADSTQIQTPATPQTHATAPTQTPPHPVQQLTAQQLQQQQQQQQHQQQQQQQQQVVGASGGGDQLQFMHLTDDIRDSLDLLSPDQKASEYYSGEFQNTEFNENKPLADLLLNQNMVSYNQDGTLLSQGGTVLGTSQMIAQAYNQAQQLSTTSMTQQQQQQILASQMAGQMGITIIPAPTQDGTTADGQAATMVTDEGQSAGTIQTINGTSYASNMVGSSQPSGSSSISAFPLGQNVIIASPGTPQQAGNFMFTSTGQVATGMGQNVIIAAPGQPGGYIVKQETQEELAQTLVLASQNAQQTLGPNVIMGTSTPHTATLSDGTSVVFTHPPPTSDGQHGGKAITITSKSLSGAIPAPGATIQTQGGMQPVSLVLPPGSFLPQLQNMGAATAAPAPAPNLATSPIFMQMSAKVDKMLVMMQETFRAVTEANKRLDRLETQMVQNQPKSKKKNSAASTSATTTTGSSASSSSAGNVASSGQSKSDLKAALADYLTITGFNNKDELKRNESSSDLFIPVGTVSLPVAETPSPSGGETATSTVSELPDQNLLVLNNAAPVAAGSEVAAAVPDVAAAPDSQSGIAVTIYDSEGGTYELGPDSSKDTAATRFTTVSQNPKTVIVDPKFWDMLVEDFQKNMTSKQIMSALSNIRKPLVRNMGNNEISICSSVLKEAEEACQGRRERLAKELVFRIFTLGEVYDRNVSGVFYIKGKKMENKHKALDPAKMSAIRFLVMRYPPSVLDNPRLEKLVWKNCVDRINDALRRIYNWIHKLVDINSIIDKLPTHVPKPVLQSP